MEIRHDPDRSRFVIETNGGEGVLDYVLIDERTLNYRYTFVPPEDRGKGVATELARYALDYAQENGFNVIPTCPFVARVIQDNPEYREIVAT